MHNGNCRTNLISTKLQSQKCCGRDVIKNSAKTMKRRQIFDVSRYYCCSVLALLLLTSVSVVVSAVDLHNTESNNSSSDNNSHTRTVTVNAGENVSLICLGAEDRSNESIFWIHDTKDSERVISGE